MSGAVIKHVANCINLFDGTLEGDVEVAYSLAAVPQEDLMVDVDENGEKELCIAIPVERNALVKSQYGDGWMTFGFVQEMDEPMKGFTHWIRQKTNPAHYADLQRRGLNAPIIGRLKPTNFYHRKRVRPTGVRVDKID
jgi:hypothetical protein